MAHVYYNITSKLWSYNVVNRRFLVEERTILSPIKKTKIEKNHESSVWPCYDCFKATCSVVLAVILNSL